MTETTTTPITIKARTNMGGSATIRRHENGHTGCALSNGIAAAMHYAGIRHGLEKRAHEALRQATDKADAIRRLRPLTFRGTELR